MGNAHPTTYVYLLWITSYIYVMEISKSQLKSKLLEILREVELEDTEVIVTDGGRPVAKISKFHSAPNTEELFKNLRGKIKYFEDPTTSTIEEWGEEI